MNVKKLIISKKKYIYILCCSLSFVLYLYKPISRKKNDNDVNLQKIFFLIILMLRQIVIVLLLNFIIDYCFNIYYLNI